MVEVGSYLRRKITIDESRIVRLAKPAICLYGTSHLLADGEAICQDLISSQIEPSRISLSVTADIIHLRPAALGDQLEIEVRVIAVQDGRVTLDTMVFMDGSVIATVRHQYADISIATANRLLLKR
jgi:predicted thioesterase